MVSFSCEVCYSVKCILCIVCTPIRQVSISYPFPWIVMLLSKDFRRSSHIHILSSSVSISQTNAPSLPSMPAPMPIPMPTPLNKPHTRLTSLPPHHSCHELPPSRDTPSSPCRSPGPPQPSCHALASPCIPQISQYTTPPHRTSLHCLASHLYPSCRSLYQLRPLLY